MKRAILVVLALLVLGGAAFAALFYLSERRFAESGFGAGTVTLEIPAGTGPQRLGHLLASGGVISSAEKLHTHLRFFRRNSHPRAGEYEFALPLTPDEVIDKLERGEVKLHHFTVPEGLRADETAAIIDSTGLCAGPEFLALARSADEAQKLALPAKTLEGFLFPDTYSVPRGIGCRGIVEAMVARFRAAWAQAQTVRAPQVKLNELQSVTLASIIEKETGQPDERPHISCVFHNRLQKRIPLATDPTVIYAVLLENDFKWDGNLHKADLQRPHPYNTYLNQGLPPGPIASPGEAALKAALHPLAPCNDLFFVARNDHTTVFCPDLKCHEAAVQKWQVDYFKHHKG